MSIRATTDTLVVHCSATPPRKGRIETVKDIDRTHRQRGFRKVGYHWVIRRDGITEPGREEDQVGAHCKHQKMNRRSIGICMVGGVDQELKPVDNFTSPQWGSLAFLIGTILERYPTIKTITGHRNILGVRKACPCFDVSSWGLEVMPHLDPSMFPRGNDLT